MSPCSIVGGRHHAARALGRVRHATAATHFSLSRAIPRRQRSLASSPAPRPRAFSSPLAPTRAESAEAASVVERFRAESFEPAGYTLLSYAAVQAWAQAVEKAGSLEPQAVIASLHSNSFDTVLGQIAFDAKGDLTVQSWVWYVWKGGEYAPLK